MIFPSKNIFKHNAYYSHKLHTKNIMITTKTIFLHALKYSLNNYITNKKTAHTKTTLHSLKVKYASNSYLFDIIYSIKLQFIIKSKRKNIFLWQMISFLGMK